MLKNKTYNGKVVLYLKGTVLGVLITLAAMCIFAAIMLFADLDREYSVPFATVSLALGSFAAAYSVSRKSERKGYVTGTVIGIITFVVVTVISVIVNKSGLSINTLFHFVIIVLASAIGGIIGVNKGKNKKYI